MTGIIPTPEEAQQLGRIRDATVLDAAVKVLERRCRGPLKSVTVFFLRHIAQGLREYREVR